MTATTRPAPAHAVLPAPNAPDAPEDPERENEPAEPASGLADYSPPPVPPAPVSSLPEGWLACSWCGQAIPPARDGGGEHSGSWSVETVNRGHQPANPAARRVPGPSVSFARCGACSARRAEAVALAAPGTSWHGRHGADAADAAEGVLAALDLLRRTHEEAHAPDAARSLAGLVRPGYALRFEVWVTVGAPGVPARSCSRAPWTHLAITATGDPAEPEFDATAAVRDAWVAVLARRLGDRLPASVTRSPVPAPRTLAEHPETAGQRGFGGGIVGPHPWSDPAHYDAALGGCLLCGVRAATPPEDVPAHRLAASAGRMAATWTPTTSGRQRPYSAGFLCPACAAAVRDRDGVLDANARDLALSRYFEATGKEQPLAPGEMFDDRQTPTWANLVGRARRAAARGVEFIDVSPSAEPWHHLKVYRAAQEAAHERARAAAQEEARARNAARRSRH